MICLSDSPVSSLSVHEMHYLLGKITVAKVMTAELISTLAEHALGNYRVLTTMAAELLATAAQQERPQLDEQLYLEVFGAPAPAARKRA